MNDTLHRLVNEEKEVQGAGSESVDVDVLDHLVELVTGFTCLGSNLDCSRYCTPEWHCVFYDEETGYYVEAGKSESVY